MNVQQTLFLGWSAGVVMSILMLRLPAWIEQKAARRVLRWGTRPVWRRCDVCGKRYDATAPRTGGHGFSDGSYAGWCSYACADQIDARWRR